jgi:hypothetical protein
MDVPLNCPNCEASLRVPTEASGRLARCPRCKAKFRVPDLSAKLEDTVTGWLVDDSSGATAVQPALRAAKQETATKPPPEEKPARPTEADSDTESDKSHDDDKVNHWAKLPETVRQRLGKWFRVMEGERFRSYFADRQISKFDHGKAGVVVTDQRIVYCRNKQEGSLHLDAYGELILMKDGPYFELYYHHDNQEMTLVQLRLNDADLFVNAVNNQNGRLRVLRDEGVGQGKDQEAETGP